ncbi:Ig-like domain-containing protein [Maribellus maritimus]|uniref:Ig-like domain-containing protein n=1 Tax=Maribellus maritimus TaxID=2870838 RepID=UPI001EEC7866|nr:Ig-like domain-containing protein [Maribellus maritimus]MCG6188488.1 Ig-like domain-containing protein [Maribellus maritimus]
MKRGSVILLVFIVGLYSCEKELSSIQLDKNEIVMHYNESEELSVSYSPSDVDVLPVFLWNSENENVATVDGEGNVSGVRVGETSVVVSTNDNKFVDSCKIVIEPISNLYYEPVYELGQSMSYIKSNEIREVLIEEKDALIYDDSNTNVVYVMYRFDSESLESVTVLLKSDVMLEATTFLTERYVPYSNSENVSYFQINENVVAGLAYDRKLGLVVTYEENNIP